MTPEQAKAVLEFLAGTIERESATTAKVLAAVPAGQEDYAPDAKSMKALDLAWHIASSEQMFMNGIADGNFDTSGDGNRPESITNAAQVAAWYAQQTPKSLAKIRALAPEQCLIPINFHDMWTLPAYAWAQLSLTHAIHHRGQLSAYLRPMGAKVPSIYGPSGDVPIEEVMKA
jgi:uncharacterized damage-inducible protein DinB